jgi:hypothetical protein
VEFSTGYRHVSFDAERRTEIFSLVTGERIGAQTQEIETPGSLDLATGAAALVHDTSVFGGTSPVTGRRYRFEAGATGGDLRYGSFLADFRPYYQIARPLSLAGRLLHFGRYGGDSEDFRLNELSHGRGKRGTSFSGSRSPGRHSEPRIPSRGNRIVL